MKIQHTIKLLTVSSTTTLMLFLCSCNSNSTSQTDRVQELEDQISDLQYEFDNVQSAMISLEHEIQDFDDENWKDNVRDVVNEFDSLKSAVTDLEYTF